MACARHKGEFGVLVGHETYMTPADGGCDLRSAGASRRKAVSAALPKARARPAVLAGTRATIVICRVRDASYHHGARTRAPRAAWHGRGVSNNEIGHCLGRTSAWTDP